MQRLSRDSHPFRLLLILEWILLGIAVLAIFSPHARMMPFPRHPPPPGIGVPHRILSGGALVSIVGLGLLGLRLPERSRLMQLLYTALGFSLSWLTVLLGGRGLFVFPALLLIVVIRACLLFPWIGRVVVAGLAYSSFLMLQLMALLEMRPFGVPIGRPLPPVVRRLPPEILRNVLWGLTLNTALLFGLVLIFVLLLVGTVVAEHRSRQELALANQKLRDYALMVENQATLNERTRIAREIHDSVGHALVAQSIQLELVAMVMAERSESAVSYLQKARQLGKEALQSVRQSVATLRTDPLKQKTLSEAIALLIQDFKRIHAIPIEAQVHLKTLLSDERKIALYRITQEALTNIARHSGATQITLHLLEQITSIALEIEDNGRGFEPTQNTTGFGLQSMRERAEAIGGQFDLSSQPGQGCRIRVVVPTRSFR